MLLLSTGELSGVSIINHRMGQPGIWSCDHITLHYIIFTVQYFRGYVSTFSRGGAARASFDLHELERRLILSLTVSILVDVLVLVELTYEDAFDPHRDVYT